MPAALKIFYVDADATGIWIDGTLVDTGRVTSWDEWSTYHDKGGYHFDTFELVNGDGQTTTCAIRVRHIHVGEE